MTATATVQDKPGTFASHTVRKGKATGKAAGKGPKPRIHVLDLVDDDGEPVKVTLTFTPGRTTVERKGFVVLGGHRHLIRNKKGEVQKFPIEVDAVFVEAKFDGNVKRRVHATAYCKPPDAYSYSKGRKLAIRNLLRQGDKLASVYVRNQIAAAMFGAKPEKAEKKFHNNGSAADASALKEARV